LVDVDHAPDARPNIVYLVHFVSNGKAKACACSLSSASKQQ